MTRKEIKDAAVLLVIVFTISTALVMLANHRSFPHPVMLWKSGLSGLATGLLWVGNGLMSDLLSKKISWIEAPVRRLLIAIAGTLAYTFLIWWFIATAWMTLEMGFDLMRPLREFRWSDFLPTLLITVFITIFMHGRAFLIEWKQAATEAERLKKEQISARYETLKNQVNPHFLFNSLNVLTTLVHKDADLAEQFIRQLSSVYRYVLDSRDREVVTLDEEIKQLEAFVFLMKIRFGESFQAVIDVSSRRRHVAPLTLQMLVENAVKHNEVSKAHPLTVTVEEKNGFIYVRNTLQLKNNPVESSGLGLDNIRARYRFLSDQPVEVMEAEGEFVVKVPVV